MVIRPAAEVDHQPGPASTNGVLGLRPDPKQLFDHQPEVQLDTLKQLTGRSILSADLFTKAHLVELFKLAALLQSGEFPAGRALTGKILAAAFFEPSTRTRLSFESAMLRLGGQTISIADGATTGVAKGESLRDIGQMFNSYADIVVVRHTEQSAIQLLSEYLRMPLINGGNGSDEHPTQALADWYALLKWKPELALAKLPKKERIHLGIIGTPGNMRTVKSFLIMALLMQDNIKGITIISEMADPLGPEVKDFCDRSPVKINFSNTLQECLGDLDVIYLNSIAFLGDGYRHLGANFSLSAESELKPGAVILHPLARGSELDVSLDDTPHNLYFNQADGAVFVREALLLTVLGRVETVLQGEYTA